MLGCTGTSLHFRPTTAVPEVQVDQPVEWLQWLVSELLLTQWGLELEGDLWFRGD